MTSAVKIKFATLMSNYFVNYQSLVLVYKVSNNLGPLYIREFFKLKTVEYNLQGIGTKLVLTHLT